MEDIDGMFVGVAEGTVVVVTVGDVDGVLDDGANVGIDVATVTLRIRLL